MSFLSRINRLHIIAAGGVVFVVLLVAFSLSFLQPKLQEIKSVRANQQEQENTWKKLPEKIAALSQAQQNFESSKAGAQAMLASQPKFTSTAPFDVMFELNREFGTSPGSTGPALLRFFASKGYQPVGIALPAIPWTPQALPPLLTIPMTSFSVQARSLPAVINFLRQLKDMPRIGVISGVTIQGTSPGLTVTAPLTVYIMTPNALAQPSLASVAAAMKAQGAAAAPAGGPRKMRIGFGRRD